MEKQYLLFDCRIRVELIEGLVRIVNDPPLRRAVAMQPVAATKILVEKISTDYEVTYGKKLKLRYDSFVVEIWGHLYFGYLLLKYRKVLQTIFMFGLYRRFLRSCDVIDCGEREKDPNRWLWDGLVFLRKTLPKRLRNVARFDSH